MLLLHFTLWVMYMGYVFENEINFPLVKKLNYIILYVLQAAHLIQVGFFS